MKRIVLGALLTIATTPVFLLFNQPAEAQINYCDSAQTNNAGNHANAYADGYREGQQSARDRQTYRPRTAGGEFDRGFYDGYYNRPYRDGRYVSRDCDLQVDTNSQRNGDNGYWRRNGNDTRWRRDRNNARRQRNANDTSWQRDRGNVNDTSWQRDRGNVNDTSWQRDRGNGNDTSWQRDRR